MTSFNFNISLSVLNHLGRNLYRSFATVLGEAISNAWDADAKNVFIIIDREKNYFSIEDDGIGMNADGFQHKFLKVGYSKRKTGSTISASGRPYIGRKGIGKLALLSCAEKIHVISKMNNEGITGGIINNSILNAAIDDDHNNYPLEDISKSSAFKILDTKTQGTYLLFEGIKDNIKNTPEYLKTIIALYFRFSTIDPNFNIFLNNELITTDDLKTLIDDTEFLWNINNLSNDKFVEEIRKKIKSPENHLTLTLEPETENVNGFIVSVDKPSNLTIRGTGEALTVDLFVNGRLREKDILKHMRTKRVPESYIYGQINYNSLEGEEDRFTSSRESVKEDDPKFRDFLDRLRTQVINRIMNQWDELRDARGKDGDSGNPRLTPKQRKSKELFNATANEYTDNISSTDSLHDELDKWLRQLREEAQFNYPSYSECFLSENLTRKYINYKNMPIPEAQRNKAKNWKEGEEASKDACGMNIDIRQADSTLNYLDMTELSFIAEPGKGGDTHSLQHKAKEFRPIRNAVMHTGLLCDDAKIKLTSVFNEIKARLKTLIKVG